MHITDERIQSLREKMKEYRMDAYLVPTADFHESEYVGEYFKCRKYLTGFTGSAGTAVITMNEACLWVDGRYFVQAAAELKGSCVKMMKMGQEGVPSVQEYLEENVPEGGCLGFDGRVVNSLTGLSLEKNLREKSARIACTEDLVGMIWQERPELSSEPAWILEKKYAGKPAADKIADVRAAMKKVHATVHVLTTLDDIAWLLNIRGNDISYNPVVLSYVMITMEDVRLFINEAVLNDEICGYLESMGVVILPYNDIYKEAGALQGEKVLFEREKGNYALYQAMAAQNEIIDRMNPTSEAKAKKNPVEVENEKKAHIKDGIAVTRFMYWLKHQIGKETITEMSASEKLEGFRKEQEGYIEPSFNTISAYGPNAAMCHYSATEESNAVLDAKSFYLVDSGGQYYEGTTDITRTIALGPVTDEEKEHYTLVLMSMLRLGHVKFLEGCSGLSLDYAAREPFWKRGLDFNHGTGHGVGYLLNVHERPIGIRYRVVPERQENTPFMPGMVCSDEPGIYIEGSHGIRTENLIYCKKDEKTDYGQFLSFEYLTYVPIDLEPVDVSLMEEQDLAWLNEYHAQVYEKIAPHLDAEEAAWLKEVTRPLSK